MERPKRARQFECLADAGPSLQLGLLGDPENPSQEATSIAPGRFSRPPLAAIPDLAFIETPAKPGGSPFLAQSRIIYL